MPSDIFWVAVEATTLISMCFSLFQGVSIGVYLFERERAEISLFG